MTRDISSSNIDSNDLRTPHQVAPFQPWRSEETPHLHTRGGDAPVLSRRSLLTRALGTVMAASTASTAASVFTGTGSTFASAAGGASATSPIVKEFRQLEYKDPTTGETLRYNLFVPKGYNKSKSYPLVLFMHDSSVLSTVTTTTLTQGLGAVCWASAADQAKHPAFVLAPQYDSVVVDDHSGYTVSNMLETTVDLVKSLTRQYSIDTKRLYNTGQSMGAMMSIVMDIRHPDLFAASFIVAGQWNPTTVKPMTHKKLWIVVSQGDEKAYPTENAMTAVWEKNGAKISRAVWNAKWTTAQLDAAAKRMMAQGRSINYAAFKQGTVVPSGQSDSPLAEHMNTWRVAYTIDAIRSWMFQQHL